MTEKAPDRPEYYGTCANCGQTFVPNGTHGAGCGCGYSLSAHEQNCWGKDGKTPHPLNPALATEELRHRRQATAARREGRMTPILLAAQAIVIAAAVHAGLPPDSLVALAQCESSLNPLAVNEPNLGLFQLSRYGKLPAFFQAGYTDVWDAGQQSEFVAGGILAGEVSAWPQCGRGLRWTD